MKWTAGIIWVALLLGWGLAFSEPTFALPKDITLISQDEQGVILEMTLPRFQTETVMGPDGPYQRIALDGWARTSEAGSPELPMKAVLLQVPAESGVQVQILQDFYETLTNCQIYPVPELTVSENGEATTAFVKDQDAYRASTFYPGALASIRASGMLRRTAVGRLQIYPFQWNPETRELRYHKKVRLRIKFDNPMFQSTICNLKSEIPKVPLPAFETLKKRTILNYKKAVQNPLRQSTAQNLKSEICRLPNGHSDGDPGGGDLSPDL